MKIISKKPLWEGKFLRSSLIKYTPSGGEPHDPSGRQTQQGATGKIWEWESIDRVNCPGVVAIVPFTDNNEVLLIRQFRPPVNGYVIELPAGLCETGESLKDAATRELLEETGYAAARMKFLIKGPMSSGLTSEMLAVFVATGLTFSGEAESDETEEIEVLTVPEDQLAARLYDLQAAGNYIDLKLFGLIGIARST